MGTEDSPGRYIYISRRLTREIIDEHLAAKPGFPSGELSLNTGDVGFKMRPPDLDLDNPYVLAREATDAVAHVTGSLENPMEYIRASLDVHAVTFNVFEGWEDDVNAEVAGFRAAGWVDGPGLVFAGLFGSLHNFIGYARGESRAKGGWWPSAAPGLYRLLAAGREPGEPQVASSALADEETLSDDERCRIAAKILFRLDLPPAEPREFLARTHILRRNLGLTAPPDSSYDLVIIGAPIWVRNNISRDRPDPVPLGEVKIPDAPPPPSRQIRWRRLFGSDK